MLTQVDINHAHIFCGIGGGAKGFNRGQARVGKLTARFRCLGGVDVDAAAIRDFTRIAGVPGTVLDLFSRDQYRAFHGHEPPAGWREATPDDLRRAFQNKHPHIGFLSAPCKGFSGLLSETQSKTAKYQALNGLTLRGIWLFLEAYKDDPVELVIFENVPRIATRGRRLLDEIIALLRSYGYAVAETTHDCGELGGLAQSRKRFLLVARYIGKVPNFLYEPEKKRLRGVGEVLDKLPLPLSGLGGPMHRMPALQWKTWVRLAFVKAGSDWRSLNDLAVADGVLRDFGIAPDYSHNSTLGVTPWDEHMGAVSGRSVPTTGAYAVADPRPGFGPSTHHHVLKVGDWSKHAGTVTSSHHPAGGALSVADPRVDGHPKSVQLGVGHWHQPAPVVTSKMIAGGGRHAVADPRLDGKPRFNNTFRIVPYDGTSPAVAGPGGPAGGLAVADPRASGFKGAFGVLPFKDSAGAVAGESLPPNGRFAVADPRPPQREDYKQTKYRVTGQDEPTGAVIAASTTGNGAFAVADPRPGFTRDGRNRYVSAGHYGVLSIEESAKAVSGSACLDNGFNSVADPRLAAAGGEPIELPQANDRLVCVIRALDGTWHRPFTTLELAAIQSLVDPEEHLELDGLSDSAWRERIGNMVPPASAEAIAGVMGRTLLGAMSGETFLLSNEPIWVRNVAVGLMASQ